MKPPLLGWTPLIYRIVCSSIFLLSFYYCEADATTRNAEHCAAVNRSDDGKRYLATNKCEEEITVVYCSAGKPLFGRRCGEGKGANSYYTHLRTMKPGESSPFLFDDGRFAFCFGKINEFAKPMPFQSDASGNYKCEAPAQDASVKPPPKPAKDESIYMTAMVPGADQRRACRQAEIIAATTSGDSTPCVCETKSTSTKKFYLCRSRSTQPSEIDAEATETWLALQRHIAEVCRNGPSPRACAKKQASFGVRN